MEEIDLKSKIISNAELMVEKTDSYKGKIVIDTIIECSFNIRPEGFDIKKAHLILKLEDCYSEDFIRVFDGCRVEGCIISGTDT